VKVTISFRDDELYRAVRVRAAQSGRQIRDIVEEALEMWLTAQEDAEDIVAAKEALAEYDGKGGVDLDTYFQRLVAEGKVQYGSDSDR
jgi:plasmid stability protein